MKTTKKRLLLGIAGAALLCAGAVFTTLAATAEAPITDETMLANIEALSRHEGGYCPGGCSVIGWGFSQIVRCNCTTTWILSSCDQWGC